MSKKSTTKYPGFVRIISGKWGRKKLPVVKMQSLRPTSVRFRETLFNWLASTVSNSYCLDCFTGSGALAFEALSRGAKHVCMLDASYNVIKQLKSNLIACNQNTHTIIHTECLRYLSQAATTQFNIVFLDPPFDTNLAQEAITLLEANNWLTSNAWVYLEKSTLLMEPTVPVTWEKWRIKKTQTVTYQLYRCNKVDDVT